MLEFIADIHPLITHFPIVLLLLLSGTLLRGFFNQLSPKEHISMSSVTGITGAILISFISGLAAAEYCNQSFVVPEEIIASHYRWARISLIGSFLLFGMSIVIAYSTSVSKLAIWIYRIALVFLLGVVALTSYLGGALVFDYGAGVSLTNPVLKK